MSKIVVVADLFKEQYAGGAELTTEALLEKSPFQVQRINSSQLTKAHIENNKDYYWIFGNFSGVHPSLLLLAAKTLKYSVLEYDYKFCRYRLPQLHEKQEGSECDCELTKQGKITSIFLSQAKTIWWMSEKQKQAYCDRFPFLSKANDFVLSSVFSDETLQNFENFKQKDRSDTWIIQGSRSWVKGLEQTIKYAVDNKLDYEIVQNLTHKEMLQKLASSKGLLFLPAGFDTCPRVAIEAKLLGCELIINDNIQHKDEPWFRSRETILTYLKNQKELFWKEVIGQIQEQNSNFFDENKFSFACPSYNEGYRLRRFLKSCLEVKGLNEVHVVDHRSSDNTQEIIEEMRPVLERQGIRLISSYEERDFSSNFTMADLRNVAVDACTNDVVYSVDADWIFGPNFSSLMREAFRALSIPGVYAAGHEMFSVDEFIDIEAARVTKHGKCFKHVAIPRIVLKNRSKCRQTGSRGKYFQWEATTNNTSWVTIAYLPSAVVAMNDKEQERKNLRTTMNKFFELSLNSDDFDNTSWLEAYEQGQIESDVTANDYYHESNSLDVNLEGEEFFV